MHNVFKLLINYLKSIISTISKIISMFLLLFSDTKSQTAATVLDVSTKLSHSGLTKLPQQDEN